MVGLSLSGGVAPKLGRSERMARLREVDAGQPGRRPGAVSGSRTSGGDKFLERDAQARTARSPGSPPTIRLNDGDDAANSRGSLGARRSGEGGKVYRQGPSWRRRD